jgi:hypothetical protein
MLGILPWVLWMRYCRILVLVMFICVPTAGVSGQRSLNVSPDVLLRLANSLQSASDEVRADFGSVALSEMITVYELEFDKLSVAGQVSHREMARQARWAAALQDFLDGLYAARDELDAGALVEVFVSPPVTVQLSIGERLLAVSSPRIDNPQALSQQIVQVYCDSFVCDPDVIDPPQPKPVIPAARGGWSFAAGKASTFETDDGLGFMFADVRRRARKEQVCIQIYEELQRLSTALADARRRGLAVDMKVLQVRASGHGDDQRVLISTTGQSLRLYLPLLVQVPGIVEIARHWIAARSLGDSYQQLFPRADLLLAGLIKQRQGATPN